MGFCTTDRRHEKLKIHESKLITAKHSIENDLCGAKAAFSTFEMLPKRPLPLSNVYFIVIYDTFFFRSYVYALLMAHLSVC